MGSPNITFSFYIDSVGYCGHSDTHVANKPRDFRMWENIVYFFFLYDTDFFPLALGELRV